MSTNRKLTRWELLKSQLNNLDPEEFQAALSRNAQAILIDCRKPAEVELGKLPGAINIDYLAPNFWDLMETLDPQKTYFVYCRSGRRSIRTCMLMQNGGFKKVYNLEGGLNSWVTTFGAAALAGGKN